MAADWHDRIWPRIGPTIPARLAPVLLAAILAAVTPAASQEFGQGLVDEDPAELAAMPIAPRFRGPFPIAKDLSPAFPPAGSQGSQGSCVAWAVGYGMRSYYHHQRNNTSYAQPNALFSPAYIYNQISRPDPQCSSGSRIVDALRLMQQEGVATLGDFPYDPRSCTRRPDPVVKQRAAPHAIASHIQIARRGSIQLDDIKARISKGHPVAVGMDVEDSLQALRRGQVYDTIPRSRDSGHAMVVVGYDDRRQAFKLFNSWGSRWADDGFGWITYRAFEANLRYAFSVDDGRGPMPDVDDPRPQPGPQPGPQPAPPPSPTPGAASLAGTVDRLNRELPCAKLALIDGDRGPTLIGWVSQAADLAAIESIVAATPAALRVTSQVRLRPWPHCEALNTITETIQDRGLQVATIQHDGRVYEAGSQLVLQVKTPDFPSYLYVTYLPASGDAVTLLRPPGGVPRATPPNSVVTLGGGEDRRRFTIGPPFGIESVVVIASASPLFTDGMPNSQTERDYLTALRKTLQYKPDPRQPDRLADGAVLMLSTRDRN